MLRAFFLVTAVTMGLNVLGFGAEFSTQEPQGEGGLWRALEGRHVQALNGGGAELLLATSCVIVKRDSGERIRSLVNMYRQSDMKLMGSVQLPFDLHSEGDSWSCAPSWRVVRLSDEYVCVAVDKAAEQLFSAKFSDGTVTLEEKNVRGILDHISSTHDARILVSTRSGLNILTLGSASSFTSVAFGKTSESRDFTVACFLNGKDGVRPEVWAASGGEMATTVAHWSDGREPRVFNIPCLAGTVGVRLTIAAYDNGDRTRVVIGQPDHNNGVGRIALFGIAHHEAEGVVDATFCGTPYATENSYGPEPRNFGHALMFLGDGNVVVASPWAVFPSIDILDGVSGEKVSQFLAGVEEHRLNESIGHSIALSSVDGGLLAGGTSFRGYP